MTKMILGADIGPGEIRREANTAGLAHTRLGKVMNRRIIHMVDVDGNLSRVKARGQMNITNHRAVLKALSLRSRQFSSDNK